MERKIERRGDLGGFSRHQFLLVVAARAFLGLAAQYIQYLFTRPVFGCLFFESYGIDAVEEDLFYYMTMYE